LPALEAAADQVTANTVLILPIMLVVEPPRTLPALPSLAVWAAACLALLSTAGSGRPGRAAGACYGPRNSGLPAQLRLRRRLV